MDIPQELTTTITVEKLGAVRTQQGTQLLNVFIPELNIKQFSTTMFFPIPVASELKPADVFTATISRGKLKPNKEGEYANEFYWNFISLQDDSEAPPQPQPVKTPPPAAKDAGAPTPAPDILKGIDQNQLRIMRQSTLGYAAILMAPIVKDFTNPQKMVEATIKVGGKLLQYVITGEMPSFRDDAEPAPPESVDEGGFGVINLEDENEGSDA